MHAIISSFYSVYSILLSIYLLFCYKHMLLTSSIDFSSDYGYSSVATIGYYAFKESGLTSIVVPSSVTFIDKVTIIK